MVLFSEQPLRGNDLHDTTAMFINCSKHYRKQFYSHVLTYESHKKFQAAGFLRWQQLVWKRKEESEKRKLVPKYPGYSESAGGDKREWRWPNQQAEANSFRPGTS